MTHLVLSVNDFNIGELNIEHQSPTLVSETVSWKTTALSRGIHRMVVDGSIILEDQAAVQRWQAFILGVQGRAQPFILDCGSDNHWHNPFFTPVNISLLAVAGGIGNTKLSCSNTAGIQKGSLVQFGDYTKVHVITDITNNTITVFPPLPYALPVGTPLNFYVKPLLRFDSDNFKIVFGARGKEIKFTANEVIQ